MELIKDMRVCPLGLCTFEEVCPNALCVECMHRLGQHMIGEMTILGKQADHATAKGDHTGAALIRGIMDHLGETLAVGEEYRADAAPLVTAH